MCIIENGRKAVLFLNGIPRLETLSLQQVLYLAGLVLAAGTLQDFVGAFPEPFWMRCVYELPVKKHYAGHEEETPAVEVLYEEHRRKHHEVSPIVDPAVDTALVVHDERLERAEEQDTQIVTQIKRDSTHQQFFIMDNIEYVEQANHRVQAQPDEHYLPRLKVHVLDVFKKVAPVVSLNRDILFRPGFPNRHCQLVNQTCLG